MVSMRLSLVARTWRPAEGIYSHTEVNSKQACEVDKYDFLESHHDTSEIKNQS